MYLELANRRGSCAVCLCLFLFLLSAAAPAFGQQKYVGRWDFFTGYAFLDSPKVNLFDQGAHIQFGMRRTSWYSLGLDYSYTKGDLTLTPDLLPDESQQKLAAQLALLRTAGLIPSNYVLAVPVESKTQTFAAGPQFAWRHWKPITLFIRPSMGAIYERANPQPSDAIAKSIVAKLAPAGTKRDWTGFYGVGGGMDFNFTKHFSLRTQADLVWDHLFNDILKDGRYTVRFSVGPAFQWGRNMVK
jgi:hypothetical protein